MVKNRILNDILKQVDDLYACLTDGDISTAEAQDLHRSVQQAIIKIYGGAK